VTGVTTKTSLPQEWQRYLSLSKGACRNARLVRLPDVGQPTPIVGSVLILPGRTKDESECPLPLTPSRRGREGFNFLSLEGRGEVRVNMKTARGGCYHPPQNGVLSLADDNIHKEQCRSRCVGGLYE